MTKKQNRRNITIIVIIIALILLSGQLRELSLVNTSFNSNSVEKLSEDSQGILYKITGSSEGLLLDRNLATTNNKISTFDFGFTSSSDSVIRHINSENQGKQDLQDKKFNIKSTKFNGLKAIYNFGTSSEEEILDVRVEDVAGYCEPKIDNKAPFVNCPSGQTTCSTNEQSTQGLPASFNCVIENAEMRAYKNGQQLTGNVAFYGISNAEVEVKILKVGVSSEVEIVDIGGGDFLFSGETTTLPIELRNIGNSIGTFNLNLVCPNTITGTETTTSLQPGESKIVLIPYSGMTNQEQMIDCEVNVVSIDSGDSISQDYPAIICPKIDQVGNFCPAFSDEPSECMVDADCGVGLKCVNTECIEDQLPVIECIVDQECDAGFSCIDNLCIPEQNGGGNTLIIAGSFVGIVGGLIWLFMRTRKRRSRR